MCGQTKASASSLGCLTTSTVCCEIVEELYCSCSLFYGSNNDQKPGGIATMYLKTPCPCLLLSRFEKSRKQEPVYLRY
jgi:hypothetical protein